MLFGRESKPFLFSILFFSVWFAGHSFLRIGFAIAKQLAQDGAKVMVSSRKQDKVKDTVAQLEKEPGCTVKGVVCHVAKPEHRKNLIKEVKIFKKGG